MIDCHILNGRDVKAFDIEPQAQGIDYAWFVWEKGWRGAPTIGWIERLL